MRPRLVVVLAGVSVGVGAVVAFAADPVVREGNLDRDAAHERVLVEDMYPNRPAEAPHFRVRISDACPEGDVSAVVSKTLGTGIEKLRLVAADTRRGKEVFFGLDAYSAAEEEYGVIAWREFASSPCRRPRALFRYPTRTARPRPRGADGSPRHYQVAVNDFARRHPGKEIRLRENFQDADDPECCPTIHRLTSYRYHRGRDRYVAYATSVQRDR
jgi:hypothetical protein